MNKLTKILFVVVGALALLGLTGCAREKGVNAIGVALYTSDSEWYVDYFCEVRPISKNVLFYRKRGDNEATRYDGKYKLLNAPK